VRQWILVTGFGPFPGVENNPTQYLVERLSGASFQGIPVVSKVLDVSFERATEQHKAMISTNWPSFIVHFGVATGSKVIRVESQGVNSKSSDIPDIDGQQFQSSVVNEAYPLNQILRTQLPIDELVKSLNDRGFSALSSNDAGQYVCNATYFNSLAHVAESAKKVPCIFIHIPGLFPTHDSGARSTLGWNSERIYNAAVHIIEWISLTTNPAVSKSSK